MYLYQKLTAGGWGFKVKKEVKVAAQQEKYR